jgi:hypothetical protein
MKVKLLSCRGKAPASGVPLAVRQETKTGVKQGGNIQESTQGGYVLLSDRAKPNCSGYSQS